MLAPPSLAIPGHDTAASGPPPARRAAAEALEASFLAEMLKMTGLGEQENSFSGNTGESQFASFHRAAIAREIVQAGGIGLADVIEAAMMEAPHDRA